MSSSYNGQPIYRLKDVLAALPLPDSINLSGLSSKWRCIIIGGANEPNQEGFLEGDDEEASLGSVDKGIPSHLSRVRCEAVYNISGEDGVRFLKDERWDKFETPQIAVKCGWGRPGTTLESSRFHCLIESFSEVFEHTSAVEVPLTDEEKKEAREAAREDDDVDVLERKEKLGVQDDETAAIPPLTSSDVVELQLFHREKGSKVPVLGETLLWPKYMETAIVCDTATSASQRGSVRWWHLNDSGEFAYYTALPSLKRRQDGSTSGKLRSALRDVSDPTLVPAKVFLYGPKGSYDWFIHDAEAGVCRKVVCTDLFQTSDEALPKDETLLPILSVAVLYAGGQPILVPPNLPTFSITLNDCVVVEQRRLTYLWLDDIAYYLYRVSQWTAKPILYDYLETDLQDESIVASQLIPLLLELFRAAGDSTEYDRLIRRRVVCSLFSIACHEKFFNLKEDSRKALVSLIQHGEDGALLRILQTPFAGSDSLENFLTSYWDLEKNWPKNGCVYSPPLYITPSVNLSAGVKEVKQWFLPVVYSLYLPVFGTEKQTLEDTVTEYFEMKDVEGKTKELLTYLKTRKSERDEILDELF